MPGVVSNPFEGQVSAALVWPGRGHHCFVALELVTRDEVTARYYGTSVAFRFRAGAWRSVGHPLTRDALLVTVQTFHRGGDLVPPVQARTTLVPKYKTDAPHKPRRPTRAR